MENNKCKDGFKTVTINSGELEREVRKRAHDITDAAFPDQTEKELKEDPDGIRSTVYAYLAIKKVWEAAQEGVQDEIKMVAEEIEKQMMRLKQKEDSLKKHRRMYERHCI